MIHEEKQSVQIKRLPEKILALFLLIISIPLFIIVWIAIKLEDGGPLFFRQKRWGKGKEPFTLIKFRTMVEGAEEKKKDIMHLNEAGGPVFKIREDPRFTHVGRFLAHTGLDELPQLINILKGEMAFVGPRPLPVDEAKKVPKKYHKRFSVFPGATSTWIIKGAHRLSFDKWMKFDLEYVEKRNLFYDLKIIFSTTVLIIKELIKQLQNSLLKTQVNKNN